MSDTRLYKVAVTPCGKYIHGTEYDALCLVLNATEDGGDGCSYVSIKPNKNVRPGTDSTVWAISLERGEKGDQGVPGSGFTGVEVSIDSTSGTPSAVAYIENETFYLQLSGLKGADGKSAYEIAVEEGFEGTKAEWLASLDGSDGTGIDEVEQTETSIANGGTNKVRITLTDGTYYDIQIKNGSSSNGLFPTSSALEAACSSPKVGDFAFVGDGFPADIYVCETAGTWTDSGEDFDGGNVDLTDYAKKAELTQLEAEVHNLSGKYYGVFADESDLPEEADTPGYAFVGAESPFAVWNFDGEEWSDSGAIVNGIQGEPGVGFGSIFTPVPYDGTVIIVLSDNNTITLDLNHTHPDLYSKILGGAQPGGGFLPDVVYSLGTLSGTITFSLASPVTGNVNHYFWMFDTDSTAPTITWPTGITWAAGAAPTVVASKHYEISILGGVAYYSEV